MKRKAVALIFAALACACAWLAANATQNAAFAWLLAVACAALAWLIWKGRRIASKKTVARSPDLPKVYVVKNGQAYHSNSSCQHVLGRDYTTMTLAQAKEKGFKPCKSCYPYGD